MHNNATTLKAMQAMWAFATDVIEKFGPNGTDTLSDEQHNAFQEAAGLCHEALQPLPFQPLQGDMRIRATLSDGEGRIATVDGSYNASTDTLILAARGEDIRPQCRLLTYFALVESPGQPAFELGSPIDLSALAQPGQWNKNIPQIIALDGALESLFQAEQAPRERG